MYIILRACFWRGFLVGSYCELAPDEVTSTTTSGASGQQAVPRLRPLTGAWCWRRKANRQPHRKRWRNFAALTGGQSTGFVRRQRLFCRRRPRILPRVFLRCCWSGEISTRSAGKRDACVHICLRHLKIFSRTRSAARWLSSAAKAERLVPLDELLARERADLEPADTLTADRIFERRWALTLLEQVLTRLENEYRSAGNAKLFDCLKEFLSDEPGRRSQAEVATELGMTENAVKQAFHRMRQRYRQLLHDEIAQTVAVPGDVEDELRHFISVLQA